MNSQIALSQENQELTEAIIKLRLELLKNKTKLQKYEEILEQIASVNLQFSSLLENMINNESLLFSLANQLSIGVIERKKIEKYSEITFQEGTNFLKHIQQKRQEVLKISEKEGEIIRLISKKLNDLTTQKNELKKYLGESEKRNSETKAQMIISQQNIKKIKVLEDLLKVKETEIEESNKKIKFLEEELKDRTKINLRNVQLENEIQQKNRELSRQLSEYAEQQRANASKQAIMEKCSGLIASLSTSDDQYLTHYLRSNGLSLQVQRPNKNKYAMVFD